MMNGTLLLWVAQQIFEQATNFHGRIFVRGRSEEQHQFNPVADTACGTEDREKIKLWLRGSHGIRIYRLYGGWAWGFTLNKTECPLQESYGAALTAACMYVREKAVA